jgi:hypothetical protein
MRSYCETYWKLVDRFRKNPGGTEEHHVYPKWLSHENQEIIYVSQKQHACLHYLIWLHEKTKESASAFNAVACSWQRPAYRQEKYSVNYKLITQVGAWSARNMKRPADPDWRKADYDSPFYEKRRKNGLNTVRKQLAEGTPARAMTWIITDNNGNEFIVYNRAEFLRSIGLQHPKQLKRIGYKARPVNS